MTHASGGPLNDIVVPYNGQPTGAFIIVVYPFIIDGPMFIGYHANSAKTFADAFQSVLTLPVHEELALRQRAREWAVQRFSEEEFAKGWEASGWRKYLRS